MRQIGSFPQQSDAVRFAAYLVTQGIAAHTEEETGQWVLWVREEDQLLPARRALAEFTADPENARYRDAQRTAEARLREQHAQREAARKNVVPMRDRWGAPGRRAGHRPLTIAVVLLCSLLGLASGLGADSDNEVLHTLLFRDPSRQDGGWQDATASDKLTDIRRGEWWRLITPAFLHGSIMHLAFNMIMFYQLGSLIEYRRRTWRLGLMILGIATLSNLAQALAPTAWGGSSQFLGLSGVVYGLFGYVWMKSRFQPEMGFFIDRSTVVLLIAFMLLGFVGLFDLASYRLANWAHLGGFLTGCAIGITPVLLRTAR